MEEEREIKSGRGEEEGEIQAHVGKYSGQRVRDKKDIVICSHAADIPVSL